MTHVVAEPCTRCESMACVVVCPANCFHDDAHRLYINPESCVDCEACVSECPEDAIFAETALPDRWRPYRDLNATLSRQSAAASERNGSFPQRVFQLTQP